MAKQLERRTFLRGALAGGVVSVGLPILDAMMNLEQSALADGGAPPRRYISWFYGNGFILDRFEPIGAGASWELNDHMQPLAGVKDYLNVVTGLTNRCRQTMTHHEGMTVFNGYTFLDNGQGGGGGTFYSNSGGPTIDTLVSEALAGETPISAIHLGASKAQSPSDQGTTMHSLSHRDYLQPNPAITSPSAAWQALFGSFFEPKGDRKLRMHILDSVKDDVASLDAKLGAEDRARLEAHLDSVAALEAKLSAIAPACELPPDPNFDNSESLNNEMLSLVNELMSDLICYAFRCDLTRVATMLFLEGAAEPTLSEVLGSISSWHQYSHSPSTWGLYGAFDNGQRYMMHRFAYLLERMQATVELDGSNLLDSSIVLLSSDSSDGASHSTRRQPMILAGHGRGHLKFPGVHYQPAPLAPTYAHGQHPTPSSGNTTDVLMAIMRAFDPELGWIGEQPDAQGDGAGSGTPLTDILA